MKEEIVSKPITIDNKAGPPTVSFIVVFPSYPNKYVSALLDSAVKLSMKYEVILVTDLMQSENEARQSLLNASKGNPNLTKLTLALIVVDDIAPLLELLHNGRCEGVQPLLVRFTGDIVDSAGDYIRGVDRFRFTVYCRHTGEPLKSLGNLQTDEVPYLRSAFMLMKKDAFLAVEGFDSTFIFNYEDVDLGCRMTCAGYKLLFAPYVTAKHKGSSTAVKMMSDRLRRLGVLNTHAMYLKMTPMAFWLYLFAEFERSLVRYECGRMRQGKANAFKDIFTMNKLFFQRARQARLHRRILVKRFRLVGRQKLDAMAQGKRFIYQPKD
jgi:cellulose synthase/poly-beta-1,6-N-acetylglucosamine synthase-like glycosyltransferase